MVRGLLGAGRAGFVGQQVGPGDERRHDDAGRPSHGAARMIFRLMGQNLPAATSARVTRVVW
jgi:hypothetical protein